MTRNLRVFRAAPLYSLMTFALATAALFWISRGKWSDPIIDSGREWIVPDALAKGDLLYRDVVYWFGPFTPYFQAAGFRLFGSSLATLVLAGAAGSLLILLAFFLALARVTGRAEAVLWTALAIPTLVFMPNAGGSLLGMGYRIWHAAGFALAAFALAGGGSSRARLSRLAGAGGLAALAGLCRTEWGLVSLVAVILCRARMRRRANRAGEVGFVVAGFSLVFGGGLAFFLLRAGTDAVLRDGHVLLTGLPRETRRFLLAFSGLGDWQRGLIQLLYSSGMWLGAFFAIELVSRRRPDPEWLRRRVLALCALLVFLALLAVAGGASGAVLFSAAPLLCFAAFAAAWLLTPGSRSAVLIAVGIAGLLLSFRRPFHIGDSAYVGPPLLFAFLCGAGLLHLAVLKQRRREARVRLRAALLAGLCALLVFSFGGRFFQYASDGREPIPGTDRMLSAYPAMERQITGAALAVRRATRPTDALVVFPEGEILNLLSGRRNPLRHKLYIPGYLTDENEGEIVSELESWKPGAVIIWNRPTSEYGPGSFGKDYGRRIQAWIDANYERRSIPGSPARSPVVFAVRKD